VRKQITKGFVHEMSRWPKKKLYEVARIRMGQSPPGETYNTRGEGLPFFQGKAEFGDEYPTPTKWCNSPLKIADPGDILLSVRAPVGPTNIAHVKCCIGRGLAAIRAIEGLMLSSFLGHFFKAYEQSIAQMGVGSTFNAISRDDIGNLEVPVPPLSQQERIARILDDADQLRRLRAKADRSTADLIPAIFHEMFGDVNENSLKWPTRPLEEIAPLRSGFAFKSTDYQTQGVNLVRISNLTGRSVDFSADPVFLPVSYLQCYPQFVLSPKDILIAMSGATTGKLGVVPEDAPPCLLNQRVGKFFVKPNIVTSEFLFWFLASPIVNTRIFNDAAGFAQPNISPISVAKISIPVPPMDLQHKFSLLLAQIQILEAEQAASKKLLEDLFNTLLYSVFQGEL
jgi:type I restriction enzyme S subunit